MHFFLPKFQCQHSCLFSLKYRKVTQYLLVLNLGKVQISPDSEKNFRRCKKGRLRRLSGAKSRLSHRRRSDSEDSYINGSWCFKTAYRNGERHPGQFGNRTVIGAAVSKFLFEHLANRTTPIQSRGEKKSEVCFSPS